MDILNAFIQTYNPKKSGILKRYYENQRQTGTDPCGYISRSLWILYNISKLEISATPETIKIILWDVNLTITFIPKIEYGYQSHWFQSKCS